ncbi:IclR family transcriptional regulator [Haloechinothrix sp. LS1_15]|uniref:IclR family transcriptional regulator n=1 Tax=Haloechinothrix sp. LS1_15 TaxID=2652248 RepID=UPI0029449D64|nr:IclR family transcriptional regulator [Haloechinothrix sp. LS1_15]MDV6013548.1 IclR family transcriptional regulator [Haloechinothrix sp. LS1_15]
MDITNDDRAPGRVQSVERAVTILEFLAANGWSGVTDVGNALGVHKSTAFRLLNTLEGRGLVEQHVDSGKYRLGFGLLQLAHAVTVGPDIRRQAQPGCEWLAQHTDETITLSVCEEHESVTIDQIVSTSTVASRSWLGRRIPLHAAASGKIFLASMPEEEFEEVIKGPHERFTEGTITDPRSLREDIERSRSNGYATTAEEFEEGLSSIAAPVLGFEGDVVAAISISGPTYRLDGERLAEFAPLILEAAAQASAGFTYEWHGHTATATDMSGEGGQA